MFLRRALPDEITDDHQTSGNANSHSQSCLRAGIESCHGRDQCQPGAYRALSIVFIRPRIAEICEHAVPMYLATKPSNFSICSAQQRWYAPMISRKSSGSSLVESAVEPTRSANITVS